VTGAGDGPEEGTVVFDESFDASTLHLLRERVAACAVAAGMREERASDVTLAVHELAVNAVRHGAGAGRLLMRAAGGALRCLVSDAGPGAAPWPVEQGHGLWIVRAVAGQVTVSSGPHGSQVTAVFGWQAEPGRDGPDSEAT
jgi:anti-sigma regulatory factor (Ser/Thr protein kinase)